jgi:hypothetical protein
VTTKITDHVAQAVARLPQQHRDKPRLVALLSAYASLVQDLEDAAFPFLTDRTLDDAYGKQLDIIGKIVKEPRRGETDDFYYRVRLRARIASLKSTGLVEDLITVSRLALEPTPPRVVVSPMYPAAVSVAIFDRAVEEGLAEVLFHYLRSAVSAGVRLVLETSQSDEDDTLYFAHSGYLLGMIGDDPLVLTDDVAQFPQVGEILVGAGTALEETTQYLGKTRFGVVTTINVVTPLTNVHPTGTSVELVGGPGLGLGDETDPTVGGVIVGVEIG